MTKTWLYGVAVAGLMPVVGSGSAVAAPEPLRDADLDRVVAGTVGDIDQLQQALIQTVVIPRLLAVQQQLTAAGSPVSVDIAALLELLDVQLPPAGRTLGGAAARTTSATPGPAVRSFLLRGPDANVSIFGDSVGGQQVIDISVTETADSASASVSIVFSADQPGTMVRSSGVGATATSGR